MSPSGLVVSKLAVQATAADDSVNGILCLKISLPVTEARQPSRWPLFTSAPPKLLGSPIVQPLPLSAKSCRHSKRLQTVATLLALPQPTAYPPPLAQGVARPSIDVSSTTGQVYVVLNSTSTTNRRHDSARRDPSVRREYLAVLEFQVPVEDLSKVSIPLPKCLDNVIRFQIVSPDARGEVSILTEPKMLPLPASAFSAPAWSPAGAEGQKRVGTEDGWEDGEDHGPEEPEDEDEQDDSADEGSWLEGRFQSTDTLRLEWSFASCSATSKLRIDPHYNAVSPSIHLFYEGTVDVAQSPATLEAILPEGWGWKSLSIASHSLLYWTCADADWGMPHPFEGDHEVEDSFSTVHSRSGHRPPAMPKPSPNAPSLMRTTMPDMSLEEFSFEMNSFDTTRPRTPVSQRPSPPPTGLELDTAQAGSSFDLQFEGTGHHVVVLEATLVPLDPLLLVSPSVPVQIPVIRLGEGEVSVECPAAKLEAQTVSTTVDIIGTFVWTDGGRPLTPIPGAINGEVSVRIQRKHWWSQRLSISFRWPRGIQEISICLPVPAHALRLDRATLSSTALLRALVDTHGACELRLGRPSSRQTGHAEIVLDVESVDGGEISVPWFKDGSGQMTVKLAGENWPGPSKTKTNLSRSGGDTYTTPIPSARPYIRLTDTARSGASSRLKGLVSSSTLVHLFTLWLLVSLAQQVQRLRTEIAFVAEETRDLHLYGMQHVVEPLAATVPSPDPPITDEVGVAERTEYPLGRVVWRHSRWGWQDLTHHPTIVTLGRGLGWVWRAIEWLIHA